MIDGNRLPWLARNGRRKPRRSTSDLRDHPEKSRLGGIAGGIRSTPLWGRSDPLPPKLAGSQSGTSRGSAAFARRGSRQRALDVATVPSRPCCWRRRWAAGIMCRGGRFLTDGKTGVRRQP